jgi:hypothetical protein
VVAVLFRSYEQMLIPNGIGLLPSVPWRLRILSLVA